MSAIVKVVFDRHREYEIIAHALPDRNEARSWLDDQWEALECESSNPTGKILLLDKILSVARYGGEKHFIDADEWGQRFADVVTTVMGRPVVCVDVADRLVG